MKRPVATATLSGRAEQRPRRRLRRWLVVAALGLLLVVAWPVVRRLHAVSTLRAAGFVVCSPFPYPRWMRQWQDGRVTELDETGLYGSPCYVYQLDGPGRPRLTSRTIQALHALPPIEDLNLVLCEVTDDQLRELASLKNVRKINLTATPVTDRGLAFLGAMQSLEFVDVSETLVTKVGRAALRQVLPRCVVASYVVQDLPMPDPGDRPIH